MKTKKIILNIVCKSCNGTGLYKGIGEKGNSAVVCNTCKGTGCQKYEFEYEKFKVRKIRNDIKRVYKACGFVHIDKDIMKDDGSIIEFSKGGISYEEFLEGKNPKPVKDLYCPLQFHGQDHNLNIFKRYCDYNVGVGDLISNCKIRKSKKECWRFYEKHDKIDY